MDVSVRSLPSLSDSEVDESRDAARAVLLQRLEQLWGTVAPHVDGSLVADGFRPDPRMVTVGVQVVDRLWKLWRLDEKSQVEPGRVGVSGCDVVLERLVEIEARAGGL